MNKWLVGLLVLAAGIGVGWYVLRGGTTPEGAMEQTTVTEETPTPGATSVEVMSPDTTRRDEEVDKGGVMSRTVVTYSDTGFAPNTVTVKRGSTVSFMNESSKGMWVASALHPTHQLLPGFDQLKSVSKGGSYEYTFEKVGTWKYHNHVNASDTGTVVVTE